MYTYKYHKNYKNEKISDSMLIRGIFRYKLELGYVSLYSHMLKFS